jgi:hypothetical protein
MMVVPVAVRKSKIQGRGVFVARKIKKGTIVVRCGLRERRYTRKQYKQFTRLYRKTLNKFGYWEDGFLVYPTDATKYLNHSCEPNVVSFGNVDVAARDIEEGEELTYDYGTLVMPAQEFRCRCESKTCKKVLSGKASPLSGSLP